MAMNFPNSSDSTEIRIPSNVQYAIGVDGINTKVLPSGSIPQVIYRVGDGTVHSEGWENILGNKYLDFYMPTSSGSMSYADAAAGGYEGTEAEWDILYDFLISPSEDFLLVSNNIASVNTTATNIANVNAVGTNIASVNTVNTNMASVNTTVLNILDINSVATTVVPNIAEILLADDNAAIATTQAGISTTKASEASASANSASTSEGNANTYKLAAEAAQDAAEAALDSFDDRYLGAKAVDPTLDNDGNALAVGSLYFNTTTGVMKVYDGSVWVAAYASLSGALLATNNLDDLDNAATARTNIDVYSKAEIDTDNWDFGSIV